MGKERLTKALQQKQEGNRPLFIPYIMAGDGGLDRLNERIQRLEEAGAAAIELGIPFSDPVADGPTIQEAGIRALKNGTSLTKIFDVLKETKNERTIPIIFMTYMNPIYAFGVDAFATASKEAGVDGVILPDLPLEEEEIVTDDLRANDIAHIRLASLTSPEERLKEIASRSEGFLYAVAVTGTTGARKANEAGVHDYLQTLKKYSNVPVLAGFGVSNAEQARDLSASCDGVIVGSKIVDLLHQEKTEDIKQLIQDTCQPLSEKETSLPH
jgi:tryptophan synthase alpha chain